MLQTKTIVKAALLYKVYAFKIDLHLTINLALQIFDILSKMLVGLSLSFEVLIFVINGAGLN